MFRLIVALVSLGLTGSACKNRATAKEGAQLRSEPGNSREVCATVAQKTICGIATAQWQERILGCDPAADSNETSTSVSEAHFERMEKSAYVFSVSGEWFSASFAYEVEVLPQAGPGGYKFCEVMAVKFLGAD